MTEEALEIQKETEC